MIIITVDRYIFKQHDDTNWYHPLGWAYEPGTTTTMTRSSRYALAQLTRKLLFLLSFLSHHVAIRPFFFFFRPKMAPTRMSTSLSLPS